MKTNLRIGLDMDQVLDDFMGPYLERFGTPKNDFEITKNVQRILFRIGYGNKFCRMGSN